MISKRKGKEVLSIKRFYRINQYIKADKVRVVDEGGKQIGVMPLSEALFKARRRGLDLVEVAPKANPPVCKIIDFAKFRYQQAKKQQEAKKKTKQIEVKEVRLSPFIAENDFKIRLERAREFLEEGNKVRLVVKFVGRQITRKEFGYKLLERMSQELSEMAKVEEKPKLVGKRLMMTLKPLKKNA